MHYCNVHHREMVVPLLRRDRDLASLAVLAMLLAGPRHAYEMHRLLVDTHKDFVKGLPRSMYHAVDRLLKEQLIEFAETSRSPGRPERTVYALTGNGMVELRERLHRLLATPEPDATLLFAALSFIAALPTVEAAAALRARMTALTDALARLQLTFDGTTSVPRLLLIELEFEAARICAEREWVRDLLKDLESGRLSWPDDLQQLAADLPDWPAGDAGVVESTTTPAPFEEKS